MEIPMWMTDLWVNASPGMRLDVNKAAVARAYLQAKVNPDSLVRITCKTPEDAIDCVGMMTQLVDATGSMKAGDAVGTGTDGWPTIEFSNGSGVEFVIAKKAKG
jgi:hypothetical protein